MCSHQFAKTTADHIIFHVGKNDVSSEKTPHVTVQSIADLAKSVTNDNHQVTVFSIAQRNDKWSKKVTEVSKVLLNLCKDFMQTCLQKLAIDQSKVIIDLSAYHQTYQKSLKDLFTSR